MDDFIETYNTWNEIAHLYEEKFMNFPLYNETYDFFCNELAPNSNVLEIGCGPGNITNYIWNQRKDLLIEGTDIAQKMIELAKKNNPSCKFTVSDIRNYTSESKKYKGIISGFCFPYLSLSEISKLIPKLSQSLESNGILYLSFVEGNPNQSGIKKGKDNRTLYFFYHTFEEISNLLISNHFQIMKIFQFDYQNNDHTFDKHIVILSKNLK